MSYEAQAGSARPIPGAEAGVQAPVRALAVVPVTDAAEWTRLMAAAPQPHLQQAYAYGEGKRAKGWTVKRVCLSDGPRVVAFCQVLELRILGVRVLSRISRGPAFLADQPCIADVRAAYQTIRNCWGRRYSPLLIAPALEAMPASRDILLAAGYREREERCWRSMRVDLCRTEEDIRASFASTFRNRLRAAERSKLELRVGDDDAMADWMIARHLENKRQKRFRGADGGLLRAMRAAAPQHYLVFQALLDGAPVAGMSVVRYGQVAEYHTGWFGEAGRKANAGNFLMWAIACEMKRRGCTHFDAGGLYDSHGYTQFKRGLRGSEFTLAGEWVAW